MKIKISREARIGLLVTLTLAGSIWGFYYLKGIDLFISSRSYFVVYPHAGFIEPATPVVVNGYQVGMVAETELLDGSMGTILVKLRINEDDLFIDKATTATITSPGLISSNVIDLELGRSGVAAEEGDTLTAGESVGLEATVMNMVAPISEKANRLLASLDSAMQPVNKHLPGILENLESTSNQVDEMLAENQQNLKSSLKSLREVMATLESNKGKLDSIFAQADRFTDTLAAMPLRNTLDRVSKAVQGVETLLAGIQEGEGSLGALVKDRSLYNKLDSASLNLSNLLYDLEHHPERYLHFSLIHINKAKKKKEPVQTKD